MDTCHANTNEPFVRSVRRVAGDCGHVSYHVDVRADNGGTRRLVFSGNIFVGPVVLVDSGDRGESHCEVINEPRRFGEFVSGEWVCRFLAARAAESPAVFPRRLAG
jgi:hypothetical protein